MQRVIFYLAITTFLWKQRWAFRNTRLITEPPGNSRILIRTPQISPV